MTSLHKIPAQGTHTLAHPSTDGLSFQQNDELTIQVRSSHKHPSSMSEEMKKQKRENAPSLMTLFTQTLEEKDELDPPLAQQLGPNEIEVQGLSQSSLQSFLLKAEELGKSVTYNKTLTVKISD